jgi:hypothetical protein
MRQLIKGFPLMVLLLGSAAEAHAGLLQQLLSLPPQPTAESVAGEGCSWVKVFDPTVANIAFPDTSANYWITLVPNPGALGKIRLRGQVPEARHFSFNSYDALTSPYDAIADYEIAPDAPGGTPFLGPAQVDRSVPIGATYSIDVSFSSVPQARQPNTLYSNLLATIGGIALPNPAMAVIIYRTYLPGGDETGGAGLPEIRLETASGASLRVGGGDACSKTLHALLTQAALGAVSSLLIQTGLPQLPVAVPLLSFGATQAPAFSISYGTTALLQSLGLPLPDAVLGSGFAAFFSTRNNRYAVGMFSRAFGTMYLVRGKAPRFVDGDGTPQLRYWSLCQNEFATQRVVACIADRDAVLDTDGYYNVVVTDHGARPAGADAAHAFNWLPWGAYYDGMFIMRNLLPATDFAQAFQNVPRGTDPVSISGEYFPLGTYCDAVTFAAATAAGQSPAQVFEQCRQATQ